MLMELTIRQFAIIKDLKVSFKNGLNILTGETGAGKSIIIDAIQLITGGRGSVEYIRSQSDKAEIEALFDLSKDHEVHTALQTHGIEYDNDGMVILKRELLRSGKTVCRINGQLVTLAMLKEIGQYLIQLHSQHQHQNLLYPDKQLFLLDAYGEVKISDQKKKFTTLFEEYDSQKKEYKRLSENEQEAAQRIDLLQYQIQEISRANLMENEDNDLLEQRNKIRHHEKITASLNNAYKVLTDEKGIIDSLADVKNYLEQVATYDNKISKLLDQISSAFYQIEDASLELSSQVGELDFEPEQINQIEERLSVIHMLKRKYGESVEAILEYAATIESELEVLENRDEHLQILQTKLEDLTNKVAKVALELSDLRQHFAEKLSSAIENELKDLQMSNTKFKVDLQYEEISDGIEIEGRRYHLSSTGLDKVNFLISPNPGEPLKPIQKTASGGELSRIMLAIQTILANQDNVPTIIFDEIDTGVSGRAAQAIAEKLAHVAKDKQVFVVTHLPQVASMADHHYLIQKNIKENNTFTEIEYLSEEKRIDELARMLGGVEVTSLTKKHAQEMIEKTVRFKESY